MLGHVDSVFKGAGLEYEILINDVQEAIKEENPALSPDAQEELEGRKGLGFLLIRLHNYTYTYG